MVRGTGGRALSGTPVGDTPRVRGGQTEQHAAGSSATGSSAAFRVCAVIPTYNNEQTVARVAREVQKVLGHVIVVNDGSGPPCTRVLEGLAGEPGIEVVHRPHNGGKGSAVKDGLGRAAELGFSHVLQVDADGQHDLGDLGRFVEAARDAPDALVLGTPEFDASVPKVRLYARQITTFFCALETFGRVIRDPMCGFRVYPLGLARRAKVRGNYMDFDPEIAVKLVWQGARVVNLGTRVRYLAAEEGGVSSFKMVRDNLRISWMHTRLVLGACLRLLVWPWFVRQRRLQSSAWHRIPEAGNTLGIRFLAGTARLLGRSPVRLLLLFVVFYYTLVKAAARRASRDYLERVGAPSGFWAVYKHLLCFAECSLDRWYLVAGDL